MNSNDSTHVATRESWLYLAVIIALQTGQVLGYNLSDRMPDDLLLNALRNACRVEAPAAGTPFHSNRGSQYASEDLRDASGARGIVTSMSRKGNCRDDAASESFLRL